MGVWLLRESGWLNNAWGGVFFHSLHRADTPLLLQHVGGPSLSPISCVLSCFWLSSLCSEGKYPLLKSFNMIPALLHKWQIRMGVTSRINAFIMAWPTSTQHNMWFSVTACAALKCRRLMSCSRTQHSSTQMQEDGDCLTLLGDREIMLHVFCSLNLPGRANHSASLRLKEKNPDFVVGIGFFMVMFAQQLEIYRWNHYFV